MKKALLPILLFLISLVVEAQTFSGTIGLIPDNICIPSNEFPVTVSDLSSALGTITVLKSINFDIDHDFDNELDIYLIAPDGTIVELSTDNGGGGHDYRNTIIDRDATILISSASAPFTGTYLPEGNLTVLDALNLNGIWKLKICDDTQGDPGILNSWSLTFITIQVPDAVSLQPDTATINLGGNTLISGQIKKVGLTDTTSGQAPNIEAWIGYSASNTNPVLWSNWIPATFLNEVGDFDQYQALIGETLTPIGTYYYTVRFRINSGGYFYTATNNGFWDGLTHNNGVLTINASPPPINNDCSGAIPLNVNSGYICDMITSGSVIGATTSLVDGNSCVGFENDDVWFSFVATATTQVISLSDVTGSTTDMVHSLWKGTDCNNLTFVPGSCSDADISTPSGLTIGQTYYVRVNTKTNLPNQTASFSICVSIMPTPPDFVGLRSPLSHYMFSNESTTIYGQIAKVGLTDETSGQAPAVKAWVGYSTTNTNPSTWTNWIPATFHQEVADKDEYKANFGATLPDAIYYVCMRFQITGGNYYYGGIDANSNGNFWNGTVYKNGVVQIAPTPPINDLCSGAIPLTVGSVFSDFPIVGSVYGAVDWTPIDINCDGTIIRANSSVYYSVVIPDSGSVTVETRTASPNGLSNVVLLGFLGDCNALVGITCYNSGGMSDFSFSGLPPGEVLKIAVYKYGSAWPTLTNRQFQISAHTTFLNSESFDKNNFYYAPNPVKNYLDLSYNKEISSVEVYNVMGQKVYSLQQNQKTIHVDFSSLSNGVYMVRVISGNQSKTIKIVKE
jgi:subtilisin-like proprotein convertase family protein